MGGILASEVALLRSPGISQKHHILGTVNFDTPFLGMRPGIIAAGISSLFSTNHTPAKSPNSSTDGTPLPFSLPQSQAYFNTAFSNDVRLPTRSGWANARNFITGNAKNLKSAMVQLVSSYADFVSCLADYDGLRDRYKRIRTLEEEEEDVRQSVMKTREVPRIRFVNYYTVSTGRTKTKALSSAGGAATSQAESPLVTANASSTSLATTVNEAEVNMPAIGLSISRFRSSSSSSSSSYESATDLAPQAISTTATAAPLPTVSHTLPIPPQPPVPPPLQSREDIRTYNTALKAYEKDIKAYRKQIKQVGKDLPPSSSHTRATDRSAVKEAPKVAKEEEKQAKSRRNPSAQSVTKPTPLIARGASRDTLNNTATQNDNDNELAVPAPRPRSKKPKKERTFCVLPPADKNNIRDPCWAKVHMVGVDQVGAHCGLFFPQDSVQTDAATYMSANVPSNAETMIVDAVTAATAEAGFGDSQNDAVGDTGYQHDNTELTPTNSNIALNTNTGASQPLGAAHDPRGAEEEGQWSTRYADLIQDVSTRIESWVLEAMSERLVRSFE